MKVNEMCDHVFNPLTAADLSHKKLSMPDGSWRVHVYERIGNSEAGAVYRVRVFRCEGREVDFTMPIAGYCAGELYRQTKLLIRGLVPEWAA
jgi:hypothetical protein